MKSLQVKGTMKYSKKLKRKKPSDKSFYPDFDHMSEESIMHGLIIVLCEEVKKQNIVLREEAKQKKHRRRWQKLY